eukprot:TRINITY_DN2437_c0_g1_i4.p1 TRINITY_DN2437_c0_g1~~TRINITY_DN2437_c0_g1_i4.p1  ORF type:complete len:438 (-),score=51.47 TRINITY_DN2437_c0_g1_i4:1213-2526(-)
MSGKLHAGFPEKCLEKYATQLVHLGYKIAVVEQTETPTEMTQRIQQERKSNQKSQKTIKREIIQILTIGTTQQQDSTLAKCLLSLHQINDNSLAFALFDATTSSITLGILPYDPHYTEFKRFISITRPVELLYQPHNLSHEIQQLLRNSPTLPIFSQLSNNNNQWHPGIAFNKLEAVYSQTQEEWPKVLREYYQNNQNVFVSVAGLFSYLEEILILPTILPTARYYKYDPKSHKQLNMILDSQALQHLEILETQTWTKIPGYGSLFYYINKTASPFGERLLRRWLCSPLLTIPQITSRLDAIEDLQSRHSLRDNFQIELKKLPDIERICSRIYQYSIKSIKKAVYFEDISSNRIKELKTLLQLLVHSEKLIVKFQRGGEEMHSRIRQLTRYIEEESSIREEDDYFSGNQFGGDQQQSEQGLLPHITEIVEEINSIIL